MSKYSNFERIEKDKYLTIDPKAVCVLKDYLPKEKFTYIEPCVGKGHLVHQLNQTSSGVCCQYFDIDDGHDALTTPLSTNADFIITNPPWTRTILHPLIERFRNHCPTYLLFDADWMHTKQAKPYLEFCSEIISVGRLKWIEGTKMVGKENTAWYRFEKNITPTKFLY